MSTREGAEFAERLLKKKRNLKHLYEKKTLRGWWYNTNAWAQDIAIGCIPFDFNTIEVIWVHAKPYFDKRMGHDAYGDPKVPDVWKEVLKRCSSEV